MAGQAEIAEVNDFSIAVDLPSLKLWQGKEGGDGKPLSPRTLCGDRESNVRYIISRHTMSCGCPIISSDPTKAFP